MKNRKCDYIKKIDPKKALFRKSKELGSGEIHGPNLERELTLNQFIDSLGDIGFQATNLSKAISLVKKMRDQKATIFLGFTSNVTTSGLRDIITYLVKNKLVHFLVTTTGGLEEDIIKVHGPFLKGSFDADGAYLRKNGVNRSGNIFIPNERYIWFENFMQKALKNMYVEYTKKGRILDSVEFVESLGKELVSTKNKESSFTYWCYKNKIPLLCVPLADGAIGDHIYFFKKEHNDFSVDLSKEVVLLYDTVINANKTGAIILGGSVPKHHIMNALMLREGSEYTVYINTGYEQEGSNAGANPDEAKSWGKAALDENNVKVWGEASILFPLLVAKAFKE
ncbi:MAG: deoxyhypusine synthase [Candidatus Micrarchaeia archaeon]